MANKTPAIKVALSGETLVAYQAWVAAKTAKDAAEEAMSAAAEILRPAFENAGATVATVAGQPALRFVESSRVNLDKEIVKKYAPATYEKALSRTEFSYIRKA